LDEWRLAQNQTGEILRELAVLVDAGTVRPLVHAERFSLSRRKDRADRHLLIPPGTG